MNTNVHENRPSFVFIHANSMQEKQKRRRPHGAMALAVPPNF
jgi:hypothetical protein